MRIEEFPDAEGRCVAFAVSNLLLSRRGATRIARGIPGAQVMRARRRFFWDDDQFCVIELDGLRFVIEEPHGDSSSYFISEVSNRPVATLAKVRAAFAAADPWALRALWARLSRPFR